MSQTLTLTLSGNILSWDGSASTYNVLAIGENGDQYQYVSSLSGHSTKIWSPPISELVADVSYIIVVDVSVSEYGILSYSLGRLGYDGTPAITSFTGTNIIVPATYTDLPVASFGVVFQSSAIQTLLFDPSSSLTNIDFVAFYGCANFVRITIPRSLTTIGSYAFQNCTSLTDVIFDPDSQCSFIDDAAFKGCSGLINITLPKNVASIGVAIFQDCLSLSGLVFEPNSRCSSIGNSAFSGCASLLNIEFPQALVYITPNNLIGTNFNTIRFQTDSSYSSIDSNVFIGSTSLVSFTIPPSVLIVGDSAFSGCTSLTTIVFEPNSKCITIGSLSFYGCPIINFIIPSSITTLSIGAFNNCTSLSGLVFDPSSNCSSIGTAAFAGCTSLTTIILPKSILSITANIFNASNLRTISFQTDSLCSFFDANVFFDYTSLIKITVPGSVTSIGNLAFGNCTGLTTVIFEGTPPSDDKTAYNITGANGFYYYAYDASWSQTTPPYDYSTIPMYAIPDTVSLSGTVLSWSGPSDVSYNVYVDGVLHDLSGLPGFSVDISSQLQYGVIFSITATKNGIESPPSNSVISSVPSPSNVSLSGTILSWSGPSYAFYNVYVDGVLHDLSGLPGFSVDISSQLQYGLTFTITSVFRGSESPFSAPITYYPPVPPTPQIITKPMSNKALRIANSFSSASARTRVIAGREIIRSLQSGSKRNFSSTAPMIQIDAARIYIIGKNPM